MNWLRKAQQKRPDYFSEEVQELIGAVGEPSCNGRVITWQTDHGPHRYYVTDNGVPSFVRPDGTVILYDKRKVVEIDPVTGQVLREVEDLR